MVNKEDFYKVWGSPINALNQFYYEHYELLEAKEKIDKANEILNKDCFEYDNCPDSVINEIIELKGILEDKENNTITLNTNDMNITGSK